MTTSARGAGASGGRVEMGAFSQGRGGVSAGVGGVGGGTGLIAIAQQVGFHTVWGQILLYIAPVVSVVSGAAIYELKQRIDWYKECSIVKKSRRTLEFQLWDPNTSEGHKEKIRLLLEELDRVVAKAAVERVKSLKR